MSSYVLYKSNQFLLIPFPCWNSSQITYVVCTQIQSALRHSPFLTSHTFFFFVSMDFVGWCSPMFFGNQTNSSKSISLLIPLPSMTSFQITCALCTQAIVPSVIPNWWFWEQLHYNQILKAWSRNFYRKGKRVIMKTPLGSLLIGHSPRERPYPLVNIWPTQVTAIIYYLIMRGYCFEHQTHS